MRRPVHCRIRLCLKPLQALNDEISEAPCSTASQPHTCARGVDDRCDVHLAICSYQYFQNHTLISTYRVHGQNYP